MNVLERISAGECLTHKWMVAGAPAIGAGKSIEGAVTESVSTLHSSQELRKLIRVAQHAICFICRLKNMKFLKQCVDRDEIRKRPFRSREVIFKCNIRLQ